MLVQRPTSSPESERPPRQLDGSLSGHVPSVFAGGRPSTVTPSILSLPASYLPTTTSPQRSLVPGEGPTERREPRDRVEPVRQSRRGAPAAAGAGRRERRIVPPAERLAHVRDVPLAVLHLDEDLAGPGAVDRPGVRQARPVRPRAN